MKHILWCWMLLMAMPMAVTAQKDKNKELKALLADKSLYVGRGQGKSLQEASDAAAANLSSQISTVVSSRVEISAQEVSGDGGTLDSKETIRMNTQSYTAGMLKGAQQFVVSEKEPYDVLRYIKKDELEKMFKKREDRVRELCGNAVLSLQQLKLDDALRYYYWAWCLLRSLPSGDEVTSEINFQQRLLVDYIPEQIKLILRNVKLEGSEDGAGALNMLAYYTEGDNQKLVNGLQFSYDLADGKRSDLEVLSGGKYQIDLPDGVGSSLQLHVEYKFLDQASMESGLDIIVPMYRERDKFTFANKTIKLGNKKEQKVVKAAFQQAVAEVGDAEHAVEVKNYSDYSKSVASVLKAITTRKLDGVQRLFTNEGYDIFKRLIGYGNVKLMGQADVQFYEAPNGRVVGRSVPMMFRFPNNHVTFNEDVTFTFSPDKKIESIAFGLDKATRDDLFGRKADWSDSVRMAIATFLENYKTAFALKDTAYIRSIFDDYAVIITGRVLTKAKKGGDQGMQMNQEVEYTRYNKQEYMERLQQQFRGTKFINLHFTDVGIKQMAKGGDFFGIRVCQDYYSSSYSDTGYLFLAVDMNDPSKPMIHIRTWQPTRDPAMTPNLDPDDPDYGLVYEGSFQ